MKPLHFIVTIIVVIAFGPFYEVQANDLSKVKNLKSWLLDNRKFVEAQFQLLELPVEATFDADVAYYIERYLRPGRHGTERMLGKVDYYFPIFEAELSARDLPGALKYLPVVESALHPRIESPVGARGLWQFMPATANFFDLKINEWVDERHDPRRSSAAAAELLSFLYKQFNDWNLALAAYNCGPGRVKKAIRRAGVASYEAIKDQLPRQTRRYITKFKAAAYVMTYHDLFGLQARPDEYLPVEVESLTLKEPMTFDEIAGRAGVPAELVKALNPAYLQQIVPASPGHPYQVLLPSSAVSRWNATLEKEKASEENTPVVEEKEEQTANVNVLARSMPLLKRLPALPAVKENNNELTEWPLPNNPPDSNDPRESIVVWYQRQGILESLALE